MPTRTRIDAAHIIAYQDGELVRVSDSYNT